MRLRQEVQALPRPVTLAEHRREVVWEWTGRAGLEHLCLQADASGFRARGRVVAAVDGVTTALSYTVACDPAWRFRTATIDVDGVAHRIAHGTGGWTVDGVARPDLADCIDIDIRLTPFTNTLPIRRLAWKQPGVTQSITVAYIHLPGFVVRRAEQDYTALDDGRFRYRSPGFGAELTVDPDGLVIDYGDIWRRRGFDQTD